MRLAGAAVALVAIGLAGCDFGWLGDPEEDPLPGVRRPVLVAAATPAADPALAGATVALPPARTNAAWPQVRGDAVGGLQHVTLAAAPRRIWNANVGSGNSKTRRMTNPPVVDGGIVFAADSDATVTAVRLDDGQRVWRQSFRIASDRRLGAGLAAGGGGVFVATATGEVAAMEAQSGTIIWSVTLESPIRAAPTLAGRVVLVTTADNQTYALDAVDGSLRWVHQGFADVAAILGGAAPASIGDAVVAAYSSGEVYALLLESGLPAWVDAVSRVQRTTALSAIADIRANPIVDGAGRVIVAGHGGEIAAIDLRTGQRLWDQRVAASETPWVTGDTVFLLTTDSQVVALDSATGRVRWAVALDRYRRPDDPESDRIYYTGPILASGRLLVVGSLGQMLELSPSTGDIMQTTEIARGVLLPPIIASDTLILLDSGGTLHAYR
jgi:outer membrane protein assembly factor BamB